MSNSNRLITTFSFMNKDTSFSEALKLRGYDPYVGILTEESEELYNKQFAEIMKSKDWNSAKAEAFLEPIKESLTDLVTQNYIDSFQLADDQYYNYDILVEELESISETSNISNTNKCGGQN